MEINMCRGVKFAVIILNLCHMSWEQTVQPDISEARATEAQRLISGWAALNHVTLISNPANESLVDGKAVSECTAFISYYADTVANYTACAVRHARPISFCATCVKEYADSKHILHHLLTADIKNENGVLCHKVIKDSDRIGIITRTSDFVQAMWDDCYCEYCFDVSVRIENGTFEYSINNDTATFMEMNNKTQECFLDNANMANIHDLHIHNSSKVCTNCTAVYDDLSDFYIHLLDRYGSEMCMDVVDAMNVTRRDWSRAFNCGNHERELLAVVIMSSVFALLPVAFYIGNIIFSRRHQQQLLKQKRLQVSYTVSDPSGPSTSSPVS